MKFNKISVLASLIFCLSIFSSKVNAHVFEKDLYIRVRTQKNINAIKAQNYNEYNSKIKKYVQVAIVENKTGDFDKVIFVPFTDYLAGVVSKEMPLSWPIEALKTQAVVARSYVLYQIQNRHRVHFDVETDHLDQVFDFTNSSKAYQAVIETEGIVVKDNQNQIVKTYYHSDCGGQTVPAYKVWSGAKDMGTAKDVWCKNRSRNKWNTFIPNSDLEKKLDLKLSSAAKIEPLKNAHSKSTENSLKVERIKNKIVTLADVTVQKLRSTFGYSLIRSAPSSYKITKEGLHLFGEGYGHGVGLCQWGTLDQAKMGRTYVQILNHYYSRARVAQMVEADSSSLKVAKSLGTNIELNELLKDDLTL